MTPAIGQLWRVRRSGNVYRVVDERDPGTPDAVWVLSLVESPSGRPEIGSKLFVDPVWFQPESELVGRCEPDRTATKGEEVPAVSQPADDRERRIRELARKWGAAAVVVDELGQIDVPSAKAAESLLRNAAAFIDTLDAAEVPPKDPGGES